jgi:hypothetical protein
MDEILLDTTYLLPIFGVKLEYRDFEANFPNALEKYSVRYNPVSLIEAKWTVLRISRRNRDKRDVLLQSFRTGLMSLERDKRFQATAFTNDTIEESSDILLTKQNLSDYFDRQIYSTAVYHESILLTEDERLHELLKSPENPLKPKQMMKWKQLIYT